MAIRGWTFWPFWACLLFGGIIQAEEPKTNSEAFDQWYNEEVNKTLRTPILGAYRDNDPTCSELLDEERILRLLSPAKRVPGFYEESRDNFQIVTEQLVDNLDPPRFFPLVGPAQLHHCRWKCVVYCSETIVAYYPFSFRSSRVQKQTVYINTDHLHIFKK